MKFMEIQSVDGSFQMSKIVIGADAFGAAVSEETAFALMDRYVELGGNTIDTARLYGRTSPEDNFSRSELVVGRWLKARGNRKELVLVTKGAHPDRRTMTISRLNKETIYEDLTTSLQELDVDYVDVYFLHRDNPAMPVSEIMDLMDIYVKAGKIRALGASNWTYARMKEANAYARANGKTPFTISQIQWGVALTTPELWGDSTLLAMNAAEYAGYLENGIPVMGFASQGGGYFSKLLAGEALKPKIAKRYDTPDNRRRLELVRAICTKINCSAAAVNIAYLTSNPVQSAAIVGCSTLAQLEDSMSQMDLTLSADDCAALVK